MPASQKGLLESIRVDMCAAKEMYRNLGFEVVDTTAQNSITERFGLDRMAKPKSWYGKGEERLVGTGRPRGTLTDMDTGTGVPGSVGV